MGAFIRFIMLILVSIAVSLALVLLITSRSMDLGETFVNARWILMAAQKTAIAETVRDIWGMAPPFWVRQLAVVWEKAQPLKFWWLPIVIIVLRYVVGSFARKKTRL
jgi:hypothetical protein